MEAIIVLLVLAAFLFLGYIMTKKSNAKLKEKGFDPKNLLVNVKYMCGHPDLNDPSPINLGVKDGNVYLIDAFGKDIASIPESQIKNIYVEDSTTIQRRPTVVRFLAVGILAFAWQKKKKSEQAYLGIEWNDGRFDHDTIFEYGGKGSMQRANTARNKLIQQIKKQTL